MKASMKEVTVQFPKPFQSDQVVNNFRTEMGDSNTSCTTFNLRETSQSRLLWGWEMS
jgi:hypothetical protein